MAEKIRISKRTVRKPSTPNRQHSATKAIPSDPAKMTKAQRRSEKHRILEERNQQILELGSRLAPLHPTGLPKKPARVKLQIAVPIAIGFFPSESGSINPQMYKWLIPDTVAYHDARFGQLMTVPTPSGPQQVIYAFTVKGNQVKAPSGRVEPSASIIGFTEAKATPDQVAALKIRVDEIRVKREQKLGRNREHYLAHKRNKEKRAGIRKQIRRIQNMPIWPNSPKPR